MRNDGYRTFKANETLAAKRRVKIDTSETTAEPPKIKYADAAENCIGVVDYSADTNDLVSVKMLDSDGTHECEVTISSSIVVGTNLYGAADGKLSDAARGRVQAVAIGNPATDNEHCEVKFLAIPQAKSYINVPLILLRTGAKPNVGASNTAISQLASDTTPYLSAINGATDPCQKVGWTAGNSDLVWYQTALPPDFDTSESITVHARLASSAATDVPELNLDTYFNEGDTKVEDKITASAATTTWAEASATIAAADIPSGAQTLTMTLTPGTHASNSSYMSALWIEYSPKQAA